MRSGRRAYFVVWLAASTFPLWLLMSASPVVADSGTAFASPSSVIQTTSAVTTQMFLPFVGSMTSCPIPGGSYGTVAALSAPTNPPAEAHFDLNLAIRGYTPTVAYQGLIDITGGSVDSNAPQLAGLFFNNRVPIFRTMYQVYDWDSIVCNCRLDPLIDPAVTLAGMQVAPGEPVCVPGSGYDIGRVVTNYEVMVLYATPDRITLKYTREDNVIAGYTLHIENIQVDPNLLTLYQSMDSAGRGRLPALYAGQFVGRAITTEVGIAIRDTGMFMDPRSRKDWWQGR